ncbi:hypothetical protein E3N88_14123 [Mikania micrantha]|uniref:Uncharacterized protein n=1 Tax=Mikania micrantha TaxID=192012 RepID=A0A5N6P2L2_9ASTR|nr:hypothetical protein E3N88_14123 [Mikania micrantha]
MCVITKPFMVCVEHKVKEDVKASEDYVTKERKSSIKWNDVDHLDNISVMWDHFEQMDIKDQQEQIKRENGKGKEIEPNIETGKITTLEEMEIFLDLLGSININRLNKWTIRKKFEDMVIWFIKNVVKQQSLWPPKIDNQVVKLYDLDFKCINQWWKGKGERNKLWVLLAADTGFDSRKGYKLMFIYNEYLDLMEWLYKNMKSRKKQQGIYTFET